MADVNSLKTEGTNVARGLDDTYLDRNPVAGPVLQVTGDTLAGITRVLGQSTVDAVNNTEGAPLRNGLIDRTEIRADTILRNLLFPRSWAGRALGVIAGWFPRLRNIRGVNRASGSTDLSLYERDEIEDMIKTMSVVIAPYESQQAQQLNPTGRWMTGPYDVRQVLTGGQRDLDSREAGFFIKRDLDPTHEEMVEDTRVRPPTITRTRVDNTLHYEWAINQLRGVNANEARDTAVRKLQEISAEVRPLLTGIKDRLPTEDLAVNRFRAIGGEIGNLISQPRETAARTLPTQDVPVNRFRVHAREIRNSIRRPLQIATSSLPTSDQAKATIGGVATQFKTLVLSTTQARNVGVPDAQAFAARIDASQQGTATQCLNGLQTLVNEFRTAVSTQSGQWYVPTLILSPNQRLNATPQINPFPEILAKLDGVSQPLTTPNLTAADALIPFGPIETAIDTEVNALLNNLDFAALPARIPLLKQAIGRVQNELVNPLSLRINNLPLFNDINANLSRIDQALDDPSLTVAFDQAPFVTAETDITRELNDVVNDPNLNFTNLTANIPRLRQVLTRIRTELIRPLLRGGNTTPLNGVTTEMDRIGHSLDDNVFTSTPPRTAYEAIMTEISATPNPVNFGNIKNYTGRLKGVLNGVKIALINSLPGDQRRNLNVANPFAQTFTEIDALITKLDTDVPTKIPAPQKTSVMNLRMLAYADRYAEERLGARFATARAAALAARTAAINAYAAAIATRNAAIAAGNTPPLEPVMPDIPIPEAEVNQQDYRKAFIRIRLEHMTVDDKDLQEATLRRSATTNDVWWGFGKPLSGILDVISARSGFEFVTKAKGVLRTSTSEEQMLDAIQNGTLPIAQLPMLIDELRDIAISGQFMDADKKKKNLFTKENIGPLVLKLQRAERIYRVLAELEKDKRAPELTTTEAILAHFSGKADAARTSSDAALTKAQEEAAKPKPENAAVATIKKNIPTLVFHWILRNLRNIFKVNI